MKPSTLVAKNLFYENYSRNYASLLSFPLWQGSRRIQLTWASSSTTARQQRFRSIELTPLCERSTRLTINQGTKALARSQVALFSRSTAAASWYPVALP